MLGYPLINPTPGWGALFSGSAAGRRSYRIERVQPFPSMVSAKDLFTVADQCITQLVLERAQPWLVVLPLNEPAAEKPLSNLLRACRANTTFSLMKLDTARFEFKSAEF